jgi:type IV secretory pathway VirD2 relaxase
VAGAHLRYLERDGVTQGGEKGCAYSHLENEADGGKFIERGREDRHQFRFIVAPEDATEMDDLRGFTCDLMRQTEKDLDTKLDWIAVDHHNTGHPHTHIIVRASPMTERFSTSRATISPMASATGRANW